MRPPGVLKAKGSNPDIGSEFFLSIVDFDKEDSIYLFPLIHPKKGKKDNDNAKQPVHNYNILHYGYLATGLWVLN